MKKTKSTYITLFKLVRIVAVLFTIIVPAFAVSSPRTLTLTLSQSIEMANDSSLNILRAQNSYLYSYWQYRSFRAGRLPSLSLSLKPVSYSRYITKRYNYQENIEVFRPQKSFGAGGELELSQNIDFTGGRIYVNTSLDYMREFGDVNYTQYSTTPIRIGYSQSLIGFNDLKWDRKIEPMHFDLGQKRLISDMEDIAISAVSHFFELVLAQANLDIAERLKISADSLLIIGQRRYAIAAITKAELLTIQLDALNASNSLENAAISKKKAMTALAVFLNLDRDTEIATEVPELPAEINVNIAEAIQYAKDNNPSVMDKNIYVVEQERAVKRLKVENMFNASVNASVGFNQHAPNLRGSYANLMDQELVNVTVSIPLVDWGVRKGRLNKAVNNLNIANIDAERAVQDLEEDITTVVNDFNTYRQLIASSEEALEIANAAYSQIQSRFIIGKADVNDVMLAGTRRQQAQTNYIQALKSYWINYYNLRKLTLFDFESGKSLVDGYDFERLVRH